MTCSQLTLLPCQWFVRRFGSLDRRSAPRFALLFLGAILARGRRTPDDGEEAVDAGDRRHNDAAIGPVRAGGRRFYGRSADLPKVGLRHRPAFRIKMEKAVERLR